MNDEKVTLANWEIAVYALFSLGGAQKSVHTEDVALRCYEFAPSSFSWIKHSTLPDKEVARSSLVDARKAKYGSLVTGRTGRYKGQYKTRGMAPELDGWMLTEGGAIWITENQERIEKLLQTKHEQSDRREMMKGMNRIRKSTIFQAFLAR